MSTSQHESDLFAPLRSQHSPLGLAALQSTVMRTGPAHPLRRRALTFALAGSLAVAAVLVVTWNGQHATHSSVRSTSQPTTAGILERTSESFASAMQQLSGVMTPDVSSSVIPPHEHVVAVTLRSEKQALSENHSFSGTRGLTPSSSSHPQNGAPGITDPTPVIDRRAALVDNVRDHVSRSVPSGVGEPAYHDPSAALNAGRIRVSAALQSGVVMGSLNTIASGAAVNFSHDWQIVTVRYTSTFGTKTTDLFRTRPFEQNAQNVEEYAVMAGGELRQGDFWANLEAGPNVIHATFTRRYEDAASGQWHDASDEIGGSWGASAQATFGYQIAKYAGLSLTGFVSNHSITYGGVLVSVIAGPF